MTIKRKPGRPKGTRKLPGEYFLDLRQILGLRQRPTSKQCQIIVRQGGVKWFDARTGRVVAKITNWNTLRSRLIEAAQPLRPAWICSTDVFDLNMPKTISATLPTRAISDTVRTRRKTILLVGRKLHK
jgi:hypothetical protein